MSEASSTPYDNSSSVITPTPLDRQAARRQLLPIAVALLTLAILHNMGGLYYAVFVYQQVAAPDADPDASHSQTVYLMYYGISMLYCLMLASGAISMLRQGSYVWALTTCILAIVPFLGPCYFLAVPFGIWGCSVLARPEVRDSFARM